METTLTHPVEGLNSSVVQQVVKAEGNTEASLDDTDMLTFPEWFTESASYQQWRHVGYVEMLRSDVEIACFLLKCYDGTVDRSSNNRVCQRCLSPLKLMCTHCNSDQKPDTRGEIPCHQTLPHQRKHPDDTTHAWQRGLSTMPQNLAQEEDLDFRDNKHNPLSHQDFRDSQHSPLPHQDSDTEEEATSCSTDALPLAPHTHLTRHRQHREAALNRVDGLCRRKDETSRKSTLKYDRLHSKQDATTVPEHDDDKDWQLSTDACRQRQAEPSPRRGEKRMRGRLPKYRTLSLVCEECNRTMSSRQALVSHLFTQHNISVPGTEKLRTAKERAYPQNRKRNPSPSITSGDHKTVILPGKRAPPRKSRVVNCSLAEIDENKRKRSSIDESAVTEIDENKRKRNSDDESAMTDVTCIDTKMDIHSESMDAAQKGGNNYNMSREGDAVEMRKKAKAAGKRKKTKEEGRLCEVCGAAFSDCKKLYVHRQNCRSTKCQLCGREVKRIKTHMMRHMEHKRFQCPQCPKSFPFYTNLQQHLVYHNDERPHVCEVCGMRYREKARLNDHLRTHSGLKPFKCTLCDATFTRSRGLRDHQRVHTGEKPYNCNVCHRPFSSTGNLAAHRRKVHKMAPLPCNHGADKNTLWSQMPSRVEESLGQGHSNPKTVFVKKDESAAHAGKVGCTPSATQVETDPNSIQRDHGNEVHAVKPCDAPFFKDAQTSSEIRLGTTTAHENIVSHSAEKDNRPMLHALSAHTTTAENMQEQELFSSSFVMKGGQRCAGLPSDLLQPQAHFATSFCLDRAVGHGDHFSKFGDSARDSTLGSELHAYNASVQDMATFGYGRGNGVSSEQVSVNMLLGDSDYSQCT